MGTSDGKRSCVAGIDYSLTSPVICIGEPGDTFLQCKFYGFANTKAQIGIHENIQLLEKFAYHDKLDRYDQLSEWVLRVLDTSPVSHVYIEGYSFGSQGRATIDIAENGGILRYKLRREEYSFTELAPSAIKKFATGKGNANKDDMNERFILDTRVNLVELLQPKKTTIGNPVSDIIDAYYIWKFGCRL